MKNKLCVFIPPLNPSIIKDTITDSNTVSKLVKLYKKEYMYTLVRNPKHENFVPFQRIINFISNCEYKGEIKQEFIKIYSKVQDMKDLVNRNKRKGEDFHSNVVRKSLKWYKQNKKQIMGDFDKAINTLVGTMAEDFFTNIPLSVNKSKKKITLQQVVEDFDSYLKSLEKSSIQEEYDRFINELKKRGWDF